MSDLKDIILETPSSSGESDRLSQTSLEKKKNFTKLGSAKSCSKIPRSETVYPRVGSKLPINFEKAKDSSKSIPQYRLRKSFSQMDIKTSKNNSNPYRSNMFEDNYKKVTPTKVSLEQISSSIDANRNFDYPMKDFGLYYFVNGPGCGECAAKLAGMKIFTTMMLNSWRKRRDDVKRLNEEVEQLQKKVVKVKNQVHVLNSVFRNEQKQNEKLNRTLRYTSQEIQKLQSSAENLTSSLISAKADASFFEQQFQAKEQENESLNNIIIETNSQLFKSMTQVRHLQTSLSCEQRCVQQLENQKNELLNEISLAEIKRKNQKEQYLMEIYQKDAELTKANSEIKILETLLIDLKEKEFQVRDLKKSDLKLKNEIETLKMEAEFLKGQLNKCFSARMKRFWNNYMELNHNTIMLIHLGAFYLLPAIPPPRSLKMPFSVSLEKVMSVIRY